MDSCNVKSFNSDLTLKIFFKQDQILEISVSILKQDKNKTALE